MGRPSVNIVSQIGGEVTPGTAVAANRFIPTISWLPKLKIDSKQFRAQGSKYNTTSVHHRKHSEGTFDGVLDYNSIIYVLNGLTVPVTTPAAVAGSTTAKKWAYRPLSRQLDNPKTYTIEVGDAVAVDKYAYGQLTSLTTAWGQDDLKISGGLIAQTMVPNQTQTGSVVNLAERPVERGQVDVFVDTAFGSIGTTQVTDPFEEEFALGEKFKPKFVHNSQYASWKEAIEIAPSLVFTFTEEHNAQGRSRLAGVINNATAMQYMRIKCQGVDLSTAQDGSVRELIQWDVAGKFTEPEEIKDILSGGVYGYKYHFVALDDPAGMGRPWQVDVINTLTAL